MNRESTHASARFSRACWRPVMVVLFAGVYVFIPNIIVVKKSVKVNISQPAIFRLLIESGQWNKGWPGSELNNAMTDISQSVFFNGNSYSVTDKKYGSLILAIHHGADRIANSALNIISVSKDSVLLDWEASIPSSYNPLQRGQRYQQSKKIENDLGVLLGRMADYYSKPANVYGINITQQSVTDSTLFFTYDSTKGYPGTEHIYLLINQLKKYIASQQANITGYPMLNIYTKDSLTYLVKVALPVDKKLPPSGNMAYKWMLPGGNILIAEVKGDSKAINNALKQMEYFINDYGRQAPAIPFLSLVTDRLQERDSSKWVTRIYYPVMK